MSIKTSQIIVPKGEEIPNDDLNEFQTFRKLLGPDEGHSVATLATAVEASGVYSWDRFGRFRRFGSETEKGAEALNILARISQYEMRAGGSYGDYDHPLSKPFDGLDDPYWNFGWALKVLPDFASIEIEAKQQPASRNGSVKKREDSRLLVIAGLCAKLGINPTERGAAAKMVAAVECIGAKIDEDTVKKMLNDIPEVVDKRSR